MRIQSIYAEKGIPLCEAALGGSHKFVEWNHYPGKDCVDTKSGYEFYYHAHNQDDRDESEHGHFHVFKRDKSRPERFLHLIGIALNSQGWPIRIFTTNEWVTGEVMMQAEQVKHALSNFNLQTKGRLAPVSKWIRALLIIFAREIESIINERDRWIDQKIKQGTTRSDLLKDRKHHVLTECRIDLIEKLTLFSNNHS